MKIQDKIKTREELAEMIKEWKKQGKKVGFTSGSFDIIHAGHAAYLEKAKEKCDVLIVAVNTDLSVKKYKGEDKPIVPEKERVTQIAAFESVDYAYLFDERRNKVNIETLKPDYYIKAGDYTMARLSSKEVIESVGGKAVLIPLDFKSSTTDLIQKVLKVYGGEKKEDVVEKDKTVHMPIKKIKQHPAIFLDRDGTINKDIEYLHEPDKFEFLPNVEKGLKKMQDMEFKLVVITSQAGIGLGYFTKEDFYKVNRAMFRNLTPHKIVIDKIYFCPHSKGDKCKCRKPEIALFERAKEDLNIDMKLSWMIGDKTQDIEAGKRAGLKTILIKSDKIDSEFDVKADYEAEDLWDAVQYILKQERK